ncbi:hypothetical protein TCAL_09837 [Tigriopus californicus]|uniref:Uncharacterized protein n=1 Tax=Tigriopus californicus TaxID=6832 RepID=A0A553PQG3_TIGCA|nr:uncharacterized protein LOC131882156 [Tigriopus californicus]TRY79906.1 hypothetical protein TCAL_09837 [Tigriopus californicus]
MVQVLSLFGLGVISIAVAQLIAYHPQESHNQGQLLGITNRPRILNQYQVHGINHNKLHFLDRQGVIQDALNNPTALAIGVLAVGGAVSLGLGLGHANARRERLRTDLDAKILENCSDTQLVIKLIQEGINYALEALSPANAGGRSVEDPALFRQADIEQILKGYRDALPARTCA